MSVVKPKPKLSHEVDTKRGKTSANESHDRFHLLENLAGSRLDRVGVVVGDVRALMT